MPRVFAITGNSDRSEQYGFSVLTVTAILTARAIAAIVSRMFLTQLLHLAPRRWLLISGTLCSALPVALIPVLPQPIIVAILMSVPGFFWASLLTGGLLAGAAISTWRALARG